MAEDVPANILEKLVCCQCNCYLSIPPVYLSMTEENICGRCVSYYEREKTELHLCTRNEVYEITIALFAFPCRYAKDGCPVKLPINLMKAHEETCKYF